MADTPAATPDPKDTDRRMREHVDKLVAQPAAESTGAVTVGGRRLEYRTSAAFMPVAAPGFEGQLAEPQAAVMTTAYLLQGADPAQRPVMFAFNGGPGSASIWLHVGALGPKRVVVPDDAARARPPFAVVDNPHTWFEHFDLVFVDPPHTGWSTTAGAEARKQMLSMDGDVAALAEVMRVWLARHRRWGSPVYLAGESYGTTRGAALADKLLDMGAALAGVVLVSCAMDPASFLFTPANDLPYAVFLPAIACSAQYHGLLKGAAGASPAAARAAAAEFVDAEYAAALLAGHRMTEARHTKVAQRLSELTGLPRALVEEKNLRISDQTFFFEALRDKGLQVGRLDARATGPMGATRGRDWEFDPGIEAISAAYTSAALAYFADALGITSEARYEVLSRDTHKAWKWTRDTQPVGFSCTSPDLARALRRDPNLRVLVASGHYDLGTPYSATDWSLAQLDVPAAVMARVQHRYYDAGHMMYTREADLVQLKRDVAAWLAD